MFFRQDLRFWTFRTALYPPYACLYLQRGAHGCSGAHYRGESPVSRQMYAPNVLHDWKMNCEPGSGAAYIPVVPHHYPYVPPLHTKAVAVGAPPVELLRWRGELPEQIKRKTCDLRRALSSLPQPELEPGTWINSPALYRLSY